jgi:hypothetical protein
LNLGLHAFKFGAIPLKSQLQPSIHCAFQDQIFHFCNNNKVPLNYDRNCIHWTFQSLWVSCCFNNMKSPYRWTWDTFPWYYILNFVPKYFPVFRKKVLHLG